jgi:hypothetical protein
MFFKITKGKCQDYLYLVESYRDESKKVKHRKICSLGQIGKLDTSFIDSFSQVIKTQSKLAIIDLNKTLVTDRVNYGGSEIVNYFWKHFALGSIIKRCKSKTKVKIDLEEVLKLLLASRLINPESKLQIYNHQQYYGAGKEIELHKLYRSLDFLADHHESVQKHLYEQQVIKEKMVINVLFYDVTTFYFESVQQDDLKDFGYSKDCKFNQTQVMMSILVNHEGRPIKFNIHKGNNYEGHTLVETLKTISKEYAIKQVVLVADRGINNGQNLLQITEAGFDYIVGSRIKNINNKLKKEILDLASYQSINTDEGGNVSFAYKALSQEKKVVREKVSHIIKGNLICTWSAKRAAKDRS